VWFCMWESDPRTGIRSAWSSPGQFWLVGACTWSVAIGMKTIELYDGDQSSNCVVLVGGRLERRKETSYSAELDSILAK
jgi:hypothetical protein